MIFVNEVYKQNTISKDQARAFLKLLNPICPHITEELNKEVLKQNEELIYSDWPIYNEAYLIVDEVEMVVQVNGKLRGRFMMTVDLSDDDAKKMALENPNVTKHLEGLTVRKVIVVKNKLINIVAN